MVVAMANYGEYIGAQKAAPMQTTRQIPQTVQHAASNSSLSANMALPSSQVVSLIRSAMKAALDDEQTKSADVNGVELRTGITIDLSYKNIHTFPDEVVDIIKTELERYVQALRLQKHA
jgi:D-aminopeptidase